MARGPCTFKQRDVTQALKAAAAAGVKVSRFEIDRAGKIVIVADSETPKEESAPNKPPGWDDVQ